MRRSQWLKTSKWLSIKAWRKQFVSEVANWGMRWSSVLDRDWGRPGAGYWTKSHHLPDCGHPAVQRGGEGSKRNERKRCTTENPRSQRRCRREGRVSSGRAAEENGWSDVALVSGQARSDRNPSLQDHAQACCFRKHQSRQFPLPWCTAIQSCCSCQHLHCGPEWPWQKHCSKSIEKKETPCVGFRLMTWNVEFSFSLILMAWAVS